MGDMVEVFRAMDDLRKARRAALGELCPQCRIARPKAHPTILLPRQRCKVDGYRDPRNMTHEEQDAVVMEYLSRRLAAPADGIGSPTIEAGRGTENAK